MVRVVTDQSPDLGNLPFLWQQLANLEREVDLADDWYRSDGTALTVRRFDESKTAGHRVYIHARSLIANAYDNQWMLEQTIQKIGISPNASWSLLRPAFEAGFHAVWLLDPEGDYLRRRRELQFELADSRQKRLWMDSLQASGLISSDLTEKRRASEHRARQVYEEEAKYFNTKLTGKESLAVVFDEIPKLRLLEDMEPRSRLWLGAAWRQLSGLQHGHVYATLGTSDISESVKIPGGYSMQVSPNDTAFVLAAKAAVLLQLKAMRRYIELTRTVRKASAPSSG